MKENNINPAFLPNVRYVFRNPFYITRRALYKAISIFSKQFSGGQLLDIGCGTKPYQPLFTVQNYVGMDYEKGGTNNNPDADFFYDGKIFPFKNKSFEFALATEVLEHVFEPDSFLSEIHRVLKEDGLLLLTVPFSWDEHEQPYDYGRYTSFGLKYLLEKNGFQVLEQIKTGDFVLTVFQLFATYCYYNLSKNWFIYKLSLIFFFGPFQLLGILLSFLLPKNMNLYLDNVVLAQKK
ncbi:class I SAM-dependent methyltransferase [Leptospira yanagawae]|uniref:class I SAM-dependent methyltransferase n=1 Tax=Leptospira yanagawae TaxID=293069 RepID=UPI001FD57E74|nr:class I SAM-dependent methyltransferase [Leptospira yanagawae]